ncbi:MAG: hypothetical protein CL424_14095 [Acidimicrobiaceae bacterium]|nr:hypothetical protein [Acidimicrobiaceae bacterium]
MASRSSPPDATPGGGSDGADPGGGSPVPAWIRRVGLVSWAFVGFVAALAIVVIGLASLTELVVPLALAALGSVVLVGVVDWLERRGLPRGVAAGLVTFLFVAAAIALIVVVTVGVIDQADELADRFDEAWAELAVSIDNQTISDFFAEFEIDLEQAGATLLRGVGTNVGQLVGSTAGAVSGFVLMLVLMYYLLKDGRSLLDRRLTERRPAEREQIERILRQAAATIRANSRGRTILSAVQGVFVTILLTLLDVPLPATVGIVNFVGGFIPYLGAFVGGAFAVLMAVSSGGVELAIGVFLAIVFMNVVLENLLEPRVMGSSMRMHPITVLIATVGGGVVAGLLGLILGAPIVAIVANLYRELRASGFFGRGGTRTPGSAIGAGDATTESGPDPGPSTRT